MDMFTIDVSVEGAVLPLIAKNLKKRKENQYFYQKREVDYRGVPKPDFSFVTLRIISLPRSRIFERQSDHSGQTFHQTHHLQFHYQNLDSKAASS